MIVHTSFIIMTLIVRFYLKRERTQNTIHFLNLSHFVASYSTTNEWCVYWPYLHKFTKDCMTMLLLLVLFISSCNTEYVLFVEWTNHSHGVSIQEKYVLRHRNLIISSIFIWGCFEEKNIKKSWCICIHFSRFNA